MTSRQSGRRTSGQEVCTQECEPASSRRPRKTSCLSHVTEEGASLLYKYKQLPQYHHLYQLVIIPTTRPRLKPIGEDGVRNEKNSHFLENNFFRDYLIEEYYETKVEKFLPRKGHWGTQLDLKKTITSDDEVTLFYLRLNSWHPFRHNRHRFKNDISPVCLNCSPGEEETTDAIQGARAVKKQAVDLGGGGVADAFPSAIRPLPIQRVPPCTILRYPLMADGP